MRRLLLIAAASLLAGCSASHVANAPEVTDDWQGTWKLVSYTADGETARADIEWIVNEDQYVIRGDGITGQESYPYRLDSSRKHIDVHHHDTPQGTSGGHFKGIYEVQGDSLKVCYDLTGQQYPKSFDAGPGSRQVLYQFQRQGR